jgi:hypothetical protein
MLEAHGIEEPDPRKIFTDNLIELVKAEESDLNNSCIVMFDANKAINDKEGSLRRMFRETTFVDIFS